MNVIIICLFLLIGIIGLKEVFSKTGPDYTVYKFVNLYVLIFWSIAPLFQYVNNRYPWSIEITDEQALIANIFILFFMLTHNITYKIFSNQNHTSSSFPIQKFKINNSGIFILLFLQLAIFLFYFIRVGGIVLLRGEPIEAVAGFRAMRLIIERVFRSFTAFSTILILLNYKNNKKTLELYYCCISVTLMILTNFPFAIQRFAAGAFYIGLIFVIKPYFKNRALLYIGLIFLFLIIYPIVGYFRNLEAFGDHNIAIINTDEFFSGNFDNYSTLNMAMTHVSDHGITYGRQLLGALLFFVPRAFWPNKPIGSGAYVASVKDWEFTNISMPIIGEGYINFGIIGIFLFAVLLAYFVAKFDYKFYQYGKLNFYKIYYPILLGMIFFILRGDLLSSLAFSFGFAFSAFVVNVIIKKFIKYV